MTVNDLEQLIRSGYAAFNGRDVDGALAAMDPEVDWANGWEGGHVHGHEGIRDYWTRQWRELDPTVTPVEIVVEDDHVDVLVDQVVRGRDGELLDAGMVVHRYRVHEGKIARMDILPVD